MANKDVTPLVKISASWWKIVWTMMRLVTILHNIWLQYKFYAVAVLNQFTGKTACILGLKPKLKMTVIIYFLKSMTIRERSKSLQQFILF